MRPRLESNWTRRVCSPPRMAGGYNLRTGPFSRYNSEVELFDFQTGRAYHDVVERRAEGDRCLEHPGPPLATDAVGPGRLGPRPGGDRADAQGVLPAGGRRGAPVPRRAGPPDAFAAADGDLYGQADGGQGFPGASGRARRSEEVPPGPHRRWP